MLWTYDKYTLDGEITLEISIHLHKDEDNCSFDEELVFDSRPTKPFTIKFKAYLKRNIFGTLFHPDEQNPDLNSKLVVRYLSSDSRQRGVIDLISSNADDASSKFSGIIEYDAEMTCDPITWFGKVNFEALLVRTKSAPSQDQFKTKIHDILGSSNTPLLRIDKPKEISGNYLKVKVSPTNSDYPNALYELFVESSSEMMIGLNEQAPPILLEVLTSDHQSGNKAALRTALFAPIAIDVWEQLARKAFTMMVSEDRGSGIVMIVPLDESFYPYNNIADKVAEVIYRNKSNYMTLLHDDLECDEDRDILINKKLPMAVQQLMDLTSLAAKGAELREKLK